MCLQLYEQCVSLFFYTVHHICCLIDEDIFLTVVFGHASCLKLQCIEFSWPLCFYYVTYLNKTT